MLNLLDSHDTLRFLTELKGNKKKLLSALALETVYPGAICIYYGTEIGLEGGYDPDSRRCFDWNEENWDKEFLKELKKLTALKKNETIRRGAVKIYEQNGLLVVDRELNKTKVTLKINMTEKEIDGVESYGFKVESEGER
jgi:glycosidase